MLISVGNLVSEDHSYRAFERLIDFDLLCRPLKSLYSDIRSRGYGLCLLDADISDRKIKRYLSALSMGARMTLSQYRSAASVRHYDQQPDQAQAPEHDF